MPFPAIGSYGPYADWSETVTYYPGDTVYHKGYIYTLMSDGSFGDSSTGEDPKTAEFSCPFEDTAGINSQGASPPYSYTEYRDMRRWRLFDLPFGYYEAALRGVPPAVFDTFGVGSPLPKEIRTTCVSGFDVRAAPKATSCSYAGYGLSAGLDSTWDDPVFGELLYSFSAIPMDELENTTYTDPVSGSFSAIFWQPDTIAALIGSGNNGGFPEDYLLPAWSAETQGQMFSCTQTFSRTFDFILDGSTGAGDSSDTPAFQDNWQAQRNWAGYDGTLGISGTTPDYP